MTRLDLRSLATKQSLGRVDRLLLMDLQRGRKGDQRRTRPTPALVPCVLVKNTNAVGLEVVGDVLQDVAEPIAFISDVLQQFPVQHPPKLIVASPYRLFSSSVNEHTFVKIGASDLPS
jgi:hypothetical protein